MKIGVLYPRSKAHPHMMQDFMDGIKLALKEQRMTGYVELFSESIGFGGNEKEVYEKAEKLLILERTDILIAYVDLRVLEILKPLFYTNGKLVIVVNPGANYPLNWAPQPNIITLTLQHGYLCWLAGKMNDLHAASAAMATTFYDCGYLHTTAMVKSFVKSGGRISFNYVNDQKYDDSFHIRQLTDYLSSDHSTKKLLCVMDTLPASLFYSSLNTYENAARLDLLVSPLMLEEKAFEPKREELTFAIGGYIPWHPSLQNEANIIFQDRYLSFTDKTPTMFSLLGWDAMLIVQEIYQQDQIKSVDASVVAELLGNVRLQSPRGEMRLDVETNYFVAPVVRCDRHPHSATMQFQLQAHSQPDWESFVSERVEGATSGWTNTYLCY